MDIDLENVPEQIGTATVSAEDGSLIKATGELQGDEARATVASLFAIYVVRSLDTFRSVPTLQSDCCPLFIIEFTRTLSSVYKESLLDGYLSHLKGIVSCSL